MTPTEHKRLDNYLEALRAHVNERLRQVATVLTVMLEMWGGQYPAELRRKSIAYALQELLKLIEETEPRAAAPTGTPNTPEEL